MRLINFPAKQMNLIPLRQLSVKRVMPFSAIWVRK